MITKQRRQSVAVNTAEDGVTTFVSTTTDRDEVVSGFKVGLSGFIGLDGSITGALDLENASGERFRVYLNRDDINQLRDLVDTVDGLVGHPNS